jgi:dihydroorotate dehydrogenase electron transfer subunit
MACGIGACLGCAVKLRRESGEEYYGHVCKDGPVFDYQKVVW